MKLGTFVLSLIIVSMFLVVFVIAGYEKFRGDVYRDAFESARSHLEQCVRNR